MVCNYVTFDLVIDFRFSADGQLNKMASNSVEHQTWAIPLNISLSTYAIAMDLKIKPRYADKLSLCDGSDLYLLTKTDFSTNFHDFPNLQFSDISTYLVLQTSFYTAKQMKAFKSLEAYNFFCLWLGQRHWSQTLERQ